MYPGITTLGVKLSLLIIATGLAPTSTCNTVYEMLSTPITVNGVAPVERPSLKLGPTSTQPEPELR